MMQNQEKIVAGVVRLVRTIIQIQMIILFYKYKFGFSMVTNCHLVECACHFAISKNLKLGQPLGLLHLTFVAVLTHQYDLF